MRSSTSASPSTPSALFYEAKVTEAISLVVDAWKRQSLKKERPLSKEDVQSLQNVISYIADHYAFDLPLGRLAGIACMSETKLKSCFKRQFGCSVTQYIQARRLSTCSSTPISPWARSPR